jgi:hypothetical protein
MGTLRLFVICLSVLLAGCRSFDRQLEQDFKSPPDAVRPGAYWYFMDGNQTREAMTADLLAMHEAGLRKALFLEVNIGVPRGPVDFMSEEWQDNFVHAVRLADELGMEFILGTGPGWAGAGGPWIDPEFSMQHLRSSSVQVEGPGRFTGNIPVPEPREPTRFAGLSEAQAQIRQMWYADVAVLAFPTPEDTEPPDLLDIKALYETQPYSIWKHVPRYIRSETVYPETPTNATVERNHVIDLTSLMQPDGTLAWEVPEGNWTIMRFAARNNSVTTRPAPEAGHGFETDKFNPDAFAYHFQQFHQKLIDKLGPGRPGRGWTGLHLDSWEMSSQNWSANFRDEFKQRRGYDPQPFFPAYSGLIIESREITERFLWDLRKTAQELVLENHAKVIRRHAHDNGLYYSNQPYDMNPAGDIDLGSIADVPSCEFWSPTAGPNTTYSVIEGASIANTMGRRTLRAEAFTATRGYHDNPADMKNQTDWAFAMGINDIIFHTYQHQPLGMDGPKPGMAMGPYGVNWHRNQTFWHMVNPYHDYIARCCYMLQQGVAVADILYLTPEGVPHIFLPPDDAMTGEDPLKDKKKYGFDAVSPRILMHRAEARDGKIHFPGGSSYRIMVLPLIETMTPELIAKIDELIKQGITVIGIPPLKSPGLSGYPGCDQEVASLAETIWGGRNAPSQVTEVTYGKGRVIWGGTAILPYGDDALYPSYESTVALLKKWDIAPVFESTGPVRFYLRQTEDLDIFFVANKGDSPISLNGHFRTSGKAPELWDPITGDIRPLPQFTTHDNVVAMPLYFDSFQSYFILFDKKKSSKPIKSGINFPEENTLMSFNGEWEVSFDPEWGGPEQAVTFNTLQKWNTHEIEGIRYYSGEATYRKTFSLPGSFSGNSRVELDLGSVYKLAQIKLNGEDLGIVWTPPYRVDVTGKLNPSHNQLEIKVVNTWTNRLIGDQQPGNKDVRELQWESGLLEGRAYPAGRYTFTTQSRHYTAESTLQESGLQGPVRLLEIVEK